MGKIANMAAKSGAMVTALNRTYKGWVKLGRIYKPRFDRWLNLARVEMAPPSIGEVAGAIRKLKDVDVAKMRGRIADTTFNDIGARGLLLVEISLLFYIGEVIGRRSLVGIIQTLIKKKLYFRLLL